MSDDSRDEQWERIRMHFRRSTFPMVVPDANPSRPVAFLKQSCGFSTRVRNVLPQSYPNYKTVHRRFQAWCRDEILRRVLTDVGNELRDRGALDEEEASSTRRS